MTEYPALPISLYVRDRRIIVVGDGPSVRERIERLEKAGAAVEHRTGADLDKAGLFDGAFLVIAQSEDDGLNARVAAAARKAGALAYAHDQPSISDLAMPALARRGDLIIAISTNGTAPALARRMREELTRLLDQAGAAVDQLHQTLSQVRSRLPRGQRGSLYREHARRLRFTGKIVVAPSSSQDDTSA